MELSTLIKNESGDSLPDMKDIVNDFNEYFSTNFNHHEYAIPPHKKSSHTSTLDSIKFTSAKLFKVMKKLPASISNDSKNISDLLLMEGGFVIAEKLS